MNSTQNHDAEQPLHDTNGDAPPVLQMRGITKSFGPIRALSGVDLDVRAGEVLAVMGENGAGKSTILKILSGEHAPSSGSINLAGADRTFSSPFEAKAAGIRVIYQEPEILDDVSVAENVFIGSIPRHARFVSRHEVIAETQAVIDRLGFSSAISPTTLGSRLSPAQRQLVEILRALKDDSVAVIAFDEPTSSLSEHEVEALFAFIARLRASGTAVIYVSHRMKEIAEIADRVAVLRDGQSVFASLMSDTDESEMVRNMVGRDVFGAFDRDHTEAGEIVLEVKELTTADVSNISFHVRAGEVVAFSGLVGAGRTELAKALAGDAEILSGTIAISGEVQKLRSPIDAVRAGIGLAPEERKTEALVMTRSIKENISLVVLNSLTRARFVRRGLESGLVADYMKRLRVRAGSMDQEVKTLSGGNQQKVVVARWLARKPKVLILDEPTRGVDVGAKADIYRIIGELAAEGIAVVVISNELIEVIGLADRILVMRGGEIVGEVARADATEQNVLTLAISDSLDQPTNSGNVALEGTS
ncbi:sugar ABC transporter ATP-binding protein [Demequina oxidasica]|uniref:sugar ABC transporter ATP-binding protein n=1 Tax=Demequina oxidasica TaxID=676199 RepID=UPI000B0DD434|nr:sugar ABC transporter ATP-binding protein [Demequina oxidasica]